MRTILSIVGTRPELIQAAPLSRALRGHAREVLLHTGQHYSEAMSADLVRELGIRVDRWVAVGSGSHARQTALTLGAVEQAIDEERPDIVLVRGDTNSTLGAALAGAKAGVPVAHTEAGTRSFDRTMPEELNRVVVDHVASVLCCSSEVGVRNLAAEGIRDGVSVTGDVTVDAVRFHTPDEAAAGAELARHGVRPREYVFATIHRVANTDDPERLRGIADALARIAPVVIALHPRTKAALDRAGLTLGAGVRVTEPLPYRATLALLTCARVCVTDSGGLQKEAYLVGTPCVTVRPSTEWTETVDLGWNRLVPADAMAIAAAVEGAVRPASRPPLYGDGHAADRIAATVIGAVS